jgi:hypothetical protein
MTVHHSRLDELRRVAYGRTSGPEEEARATAARHELAGLLGAPAAAADEAESEATRDAAPEPETAPEPAAVQEPPRAWLTPVIAAAALVVGLLLGIGGMTAADSVDATPTPGPTGTFTAGSSGLPPADTLRTSLALDPGSVEGAQVWLAGTQTEEDEFAGNDYLYEFYHLDPASTRLALSSLRGDVWVGTTTDGNYCLFVQTSQQSGGACVTPDELAQTGISILSDSTFLVAWNGDRLAASTVPGL